MNDYEIPSVLHITREQAGPVPCEDVGTARLPTSDGDPLDTAATGRMGPMEHQAVLIADATQRTIDKDGESGFDGLFEESSKRLAGRVFRLAAGLCADNQLPVDLDNRLLVLADLQRLCLATEAEIDRLKLEVENEVVLKIRVEARRARRENALRGR